MYVYVYSRNSPEFVPWHFLVASTGLRELRPEGSHPRRYLLLRQPAQPHKRYTHLKHKIDIQKYEWTALCEQVYSNE
jgi:hypothetical protein